MTQAASAFPPFPDFYRAANGGRDPFPWQWRLAEEVAESGEWPREIGVPTGLGKTSCIDIAVWHLASQAGRAPAQRMAPTRLWWVVNRRLLVDAAHDRALALAADLEEPGGDAALTGVAAALRRIAGRDDGPVLDVRRLRGGAAPDPPTDPARPAVVVSTLPMFGSRLLFRGYGASRGRRPLDAAMAGADALVLLDEAHLAPHLDALARTLPGCAPALTPILPGTRSGLRVTALTATGRGGEDRFNLDDRDYAHPVVRARIHAHKPLELRQHTRGNIDARLADAARSLLACDDAPAGASYLVFANTPSTARGVLERLTEVLPDADHYLLTGRMRERESGETQRLILERMAPDVAATPGTRPLVVVATQTLEVGADLDADFLVTEQCGVRALTQRLGRLNRFGRKPHARAVYVHMPASERRGNEREWPVYGAEPAAVLERLETAIAARDDKTADVSPAHITATLGNPGDDPGRAPRVLAPILREWAKTSEPGEGVAPVEPYFAGVAEHSVVTVAIIWRAHVPGAGQRLWPPPSDRESIDVPLWEARAALDGAGTARLDDDGERIEVVAPDDLRPGDRVIVSADRLMDSFGWAPEARGAVFDMSLPGRGLPLDAEALRLLGVAGIAASTLAGAISEDAGERASAAESIGAVLSDHAAPAHWKPGEWDAFVASLAPGAIEAPMDEVARIPAARVTEGRSQDIGNASDDLSFVDGDPTHLAVHNDRVRARAARTAKALGVPAVLTRVIEAAGEFHDAGKADERFQSWLTEGEPTDAPLAKSTTPYNRRSRTRTASGWPHGGRHEALSALLAAEWARMAGWSDDDRDLLVHLVGSHHGHGRPLIPPPRRGGEDGVPVRTEMRGVVVSGPSGLGDVDWDQPSRFQRLSVRFGPWGLALLEAIVRSADHEESRGAS